MCRSHHIEVSDLSWYEAAKLLCRSVVANIIVVGATLELLGVM